MILKGTALVAGLLGGLLLVGAVITALKPQEELSVKITMLVFSLLMVAGSAYLWVHLTRHFQAARAIIFERPRVPVYEVPAVGAAVGLGVMAHFP